MPKPPVQSTLRATFRDDRATPSQAVTNVIRARVVPAALELIDGDSLEAVASYLNVRSLAPEGTGALLLLEVDGLAEAVAEEAVRVEQACREAGRDRSASRAPTRRSGRSSGASAASCRSR